jgi:hypothetical protein
MPPVPLWHGSKVIAGVFCALACSTAGAQGVPGLLSILLTPERQYVFNHICVPQTLPQLDGFTNGDFVNAIVEVSKGRWESSLEAKRKGDNDGSLKAIAPFIHSIIDLNSPGRVVRNSEGAIVEFKDCEALGGLNGMLSAERNPSTATRNDADFKRRSENQIAEVLKRWKDSGSFDEVAGLLRSGPLKISTEYAATPLRRK